MNYVILLFLFFTAFSQSTEITLFNAETREQVNELIEAGADPNTQDIEGKTPLHYLRYAMDSTRMEMLIEAGADSNVRDNYGRTPIYYVKDTGLAEVLIEAGANINVSVRNRRVRGLLKDRFFKKRSPCAKTLNN